MTPSPLSIGRAALRDAMFLSHIRRGRTMPVHQSPSRALVASAALMAAIVASATVFACSDNNTVLPTTTTWSATLNGAGENPAKNVAGVGTATIVKSAGTYTFTVNFSGMSGPLTGAHIHGPAGVGTNANVIVPFSTAGAGASGTLAGTFTSTNTATISNDSLDVLMSNGNAYVNLHTAANPGGEIRGQLLKQP
jgi:Cu/Zn superoxide dismutase